MQGEFKENSEWEIDFQYDLKCIKAVKIQKNQELTI